MPHFYSRFSCIGEDYQVEAQSEAQKLGIVLKFIPRPETWRPQPLLAAANGMSAIRLATAKFFFSFYNPQTEKT